MKHLVLSERLNRTIVTTVVACTVGGTLAADAAVPRPTTAPATSVRGVPPAPPAPPGPPAAAVAPVPDVDPALVDAYAERYAVNDAEATRRLTIQKAAIEVDEALRRRLGNRYAGIRFDNDAGRLVLPAVDDLAAATVRDVAAQAGLGTGDVRVDRVARALPALEARQATVDATLADALAARQVTTGIDTAANAVMVEVAAQAPAAVRSLVATLAAAPDVEARTVPRDALANSANYCVYPACDHPLRGAVVMSTASNGSCSTGYIGYTSTEWVLFGAGHCARLREAWSAYNASTGTWRRIGTPGPWYYNSRGDAGIWWTWRSDCGWCGSTTPIVAAWRFNEAYPIRGRGWSWQGMFACRLGARTDNRCGTVLRTNATVTYADGMTLGGMIEMDACSEGGDSGGPLPANYVAIGIHSGGNGCGNPVPRTFSEEVLDAEAVLGAWVHSQA
ncbi:MAG TPA: S1 family peptidase [Frankiaceae bacterium]|nr:S1 family peptidase [Frankiaceae bacterium]